MSVEVDNKVLNVRITLDAGIAPYTNGLMYDNKRNLLLHFVSVLSVL